MTAVQKQPGGSHENTYAVDAESSAEMARLMRQDHLITKGMGGIFPEKIDLSGVQRILDLACGPGGWVLETAFTYTDMDVVGVDISERMITYANAQAHVQQLPNASFRVMNILQPLDFPDSSFDLINARLISGFMSTTWWSGLIRECLRILRPGGILRFTEIEPGFSNKAFFEKAIAMLTQAMSRGGYTFSPSGMRFDTILMLPSFFREAGLQKIGQMAHAIEFSAGTEARESAYYDLAMGFQLVEPLIEKTGVAVLEEWREIYKKGLAEMFESDFQAMWIFLTVWGEKTTEL